MICTGLLFSFAYDHTIVRIVQWVKKTKLRFTDTTSEINDMIRSRFTFEAKRMSRTVG